MRIYAYLIWPGAGFQCSERTAMRIYAYLIWGMRGSGYNGCTGNNVSICPGAQKGLKATKKKKKKKENRIFQSQSLWEKILLKLYIYSEYMHLYTQFLLKTIHYLFYRPQTIIQGGTTDHWTTKTIQFITCIQFSPMLVSNQSIILFIHKFSKTCSDIIWRKKM